MSRVLYLTPQVVALDDHTLRDTPPGALEHLLGGLLDRLTAIVPDEGVLVLDATAAAALRVDTEEGLTAQTPGLVADGWEVTARDGWLTCRHDRRPLMIIAVLGRVDTARSIVLNSDWPQDHVDTLALWHSLTGTTWRGTPGATGMVLLRRRLPAYRDTTGKQLPVTVQPRQTGPDRAAEKPWEGQHAWRRPQTLPYAHSYDTVRGYLAATGTCEHLAPWSLRHTGKTTDPDLSRAGWWHVALAPWNGDLAEHLPHPAGPGDPDHRWVTTPRLRLLQDLTDRHLYGGYEILDSYTGVGKRVLRSYAEAVDTTYRHAVDLHTADGLYAADAERCAAAVKALYREVWGLLNHAGNSVHRPDWHHAILATHATNLWRRMLRIGLEEDRWPVGVDVDNLWYESELADPHAAAPAALSVWRHTPDTPSPRLGQYTTKGTRTPAVTCAV